MKIDEKYGWLVWNIMVEISSGVSSFVALCLLFQSSYLTRHLHHHVNKENKRNMIKKDYLNYFMIINIKSLYIWWYSLVLMSVWPLSFWDYTLRSPLSTYLLKSFNESFIFIPHLFLISDLSFIQTYIIYHFLNFFHLYLFLFLGIFQWDLFGIRIWMKRTVKWERTKKDVISFFLSSFYRF